MSIVGGEVFTTISTIPWAGTISTPTHSPSTETTVGSFVKHGYQLKKTSYIQSENLSIRFILEGNYPFFVYENSIF